MMSHTPPVDMDTFVAQSKESLSHIAMGVRETAVWVSCLLWAGMAVLYAGDQFSGLLAGEMSILAVGRVVFCTVCFIALMEIYSAGSSARGDSYTFEYMDRVLPLT